MSELPSLACVGNGPNYFPDGDDPLLILDGDGKEVCRAANAELLCALKNAAPALIAAARELAAIKEAAAAAAQSTLACGCVTCICMDTDRCFGCGAKSCGGRSVEHAQEQERLRLRWIATEYGRMDQRIAALSKPEPRNEG